MENKKDLEPSTEKKHKPKGGARSGAGRPKGSTDKLTAKSLLETIQVKANGKSYEEILVQDFLEARTNKDYALLMKYHQLILQKVMTTLTQIEVTEDKDAVEAKKAAFAEALAKLTGINKD